MRADPPPDPEPRALARAAGLISLEIALTLGAAYAITVALAFALPASSIFDLPLPARLFGVLPLVAGVGLAVDTLRYRHPKDMLVSTGVTLRKLFGRTPIEVTAERKEPFSVVGPYRYVRNPLYLGVILIAVGLALLGSYVEMLIWAVVLVCWFWFLLIPFEERELQILFGERYAYYRRRVPRLIPSGRKFRELDHAGPH